jgi:S-adenosylmethionine:tRNA ribosyltransferase-isomerase
MLTSVIKQNITKVFRPFVPKSLDTLLTKRMIAYHLPDELVAIYPSKKRDESRLLCILPKREPPTNRLAAKKLYDHGQCVYTNFNQTEDLCNLQDLQFVDLLRVLPRGCHIFHNESKVLNARLLVEHDQNLNPFELLLLSPADDNVDPDHLIRSDANGQMWRTMIRSDKVKVGDVLTLHNQDKPSLSSTSSSNEPPPCVRIITLHDVWIEEDENDGVEADVEFIYEPTNIHDNKEMKTVLDEFGQIPIPPYLNRGAIESDKETYQTSFSKKFGSVAAPTAGLHFSDKLMKKLESLHTMSKVTLHVGAGTFKPVSSSIEDHDMHREHWEITKNALNSLIQSLSNDVPVVPVGTTSVRVLESLYWMGARVILGGSPPPTQLSLDQWEPQDIIQQYKDSNQLLPQPHRAFEALLWNVYPAALGSFTLSGTTSICISPGYEFMVIDALVTNFHQSKSTLMYLTSAVLGGDAKLLQCYEHAIKNEYRFLSFGDACFMVVNREK